MCVTCVRVKDDTEEMRKTNQFMLEAKQHYIKALVGSRVVLEKVRSTKTKDFAGANLACQRAQANTNSGPIQIAKQQTPWQNGLAGVSDGRMMPAGLADQGHLQVTFGQQGNFETVHHYEAVSSSNSAYRNSSNGVNSQVAEAVLSSNSAYHRDGVDGLVSEVAVKEILARDAFVRNLLD